MAAAIIARRQQYRGRTGARGRTRLENDGINIEGGGEEVSLKIIGKLIKRHRR